MPTDEIGLKSENYRPKIHFAPKKNWINDPNGLVYYDGEYHLFYQYNPFGNEWGHMSWGHAVSTNLIEWQELSVAIPEREYMIFSGSAFIDWENITGLGINNKPPMLAYFTAFDSKKNLQTQCLAYSNDRGRTFEMYQSNPIIDLGIEHHRDPNVFWHQDSNSYIMLVALPQTHQVEIYRSSDLLNWTIASVFGPFGNTGGQWECPALILIPNLDKKSRSRWVLKIDVDKNIINDGAGSQYFVGEFDGYNFIPDLICGKPTAHITDNGRDFYAAINWTNLPSKHQNPIWIGWMSNHQTGKFFPTDPWRGSMTIPRELFIYENEGVALLGQRPIPDLGNYVDAINVNLTNQKSTALKSGNSMEVLKPTEIKLSIDNSSKISKAEFVDFEGVLLSIEWDFKSKIVTLIDRDFKIFTSSFELILNELNLSFIIDSCSVEVFINGGRQVFTQCIFPSGTICFRT